MNAKEKGRQIGFSIKMTYLSVNREQFQKRAEKEAQHAYTNEKKQQEFVEGFMENYHEPHAKDCQCEICEWVRSELQTY